MRFSIFLNFFVSCPLLALRGVKGGLMALVFIHKFDTSLAKNICNSCKRTYPNMLSFLTRPRQNRQACLMAFLWRSNFVLRKHNMFWIWKIASLHKINYILVDLVATNKIEFFLDLVSLLRQLPKLRHFCQHHIWLRPLCSVAWFLREVGNLVTTSGGVNRKSEKRDACWARWESFSVFLRPFGHKQNKKMKITNSTNKQHRKKELFKRFNWIVTPQTNQLKQL